MSDAKISVTIATYNRAFLLEKVLYALCNQTEPYDRYEIIVCDSNSVDGTDTLIHDISQKFDECQIRHLHTKNILAAKRNLGLANARYEIVIFLDDDCIPESNFIEMYLRCFSSYSNCKAVYCGEVRYPKEWVNSSNYFRYRDSRHFGSGNRPELESGELDYKTIVVMNMSFIKKEIIDNVGYVNERFIGYGCEDQEYGWRIQSAGFKILPCTARIYHYETSGNLDGYMKKIYHTSRDGVKNLLRECPEALWSLPASKLLEPRYPHTSTLGRVKALIFRFFISDIVVKIIRYFLIKTDSFNLFYFPVMYRLVLAKAYIDGAKERGEVNLTGDDIEDGWYNR